MTRDARRRPAVLGVATLPPWERLPTDTNASWEAFLLYRDAGPKRSLSAVAQQLVDAVPDGPRKGTVATRLNRLKGWSTRHGWTARTEAFDRWVDQQAIATFVAQHEHERRRLVEEATALNRKMLAGLAALDLRAGAFSTRELLDGYAKTLAIITKLRGLDEVRIVGPDGGALQVEHTDADALLNVIVGALANHPSARDAVLQALDDLAAGDRS